jgi:membrane protease subunit HflK
VVFILFSGYEIASSAIHALRHHTEIDVEGHTNHTHNNNTQKVLRTFLPVGSMIFLGVYLFSGFYIVKPGEVAVVRRFGVVALANLGSGLHFRLPWPVDRIDIVQLDEIRRLETPANLMLTGDENQLNIRLSVHYKVDDPVKFLLNTTDPKVLIAQASEAAMRQVVAGESVDALLTVDKSTIQKKAVSLTQSALDSYASGLRITGVQLLESSPPPEVADAFRDVASAREDLNTFINEALAYKNEILPVARGDAEKAIQAANAYQAEKIAQANGEATQFASQQGAYAKAPAVTRMRLYLESVEKVLPGARKFVLDSAVRMQTTDLWFPGANSTEMFPLQP